MRQRTIVKQMGSGLYRNRTKARRVKAITKRDEAVYSVQHPVRDLPINVSNGAVVFFKSLYFGGHEHVDSVLIIIHCAHFKLNDVFS